MSEKLKTGERSIRTIALAALVSLVWLLVSGCVTNRAALDASRSNRTRIATVKIGDTERVVLDKMGCDPEIRNISATAAGRVERWSWVTNYENDVVTTLVFTNKILTEIGQHQWDGTWNPDTIAPGEIVETDEELGVQAENRRKIAAAVHPGMTRAEIVTLAGPPDASEAKADGTGAILEETMKYRVPGMGTVVIRLEKGKVVEVGKE